MDTIKIEHVHLERLANVDLYSYIAYNYGEEYIPHIGEFVTFSLHDDAPEIFPDKMIYTTKDVARVFDCGREKALKLMHLMMKFGCAEKGGKDFYTTKEKILEFVNENMGREIELG